MVKAPKGTTSGHTSLEQDQYQALIDSVIPGTGRSYPNYGPSDGDWEFTRLLDELRVVFDPKTLKPKP